VGMWARLLLIPYSRLAPLILLFSVIGVYGANERIFDLWVMIISGVLGYLLRKAEYSPAPLVLALVLGRIMENALRQSLLISKGSPLIFIERPISGVLVVLGLLVLVIPALQRLFRRSARILPVVEE
jgi:putative tricarboxylic transport membrane protein